MRKCEFNKYMLYYI